MSGEYLRDKRDETLPRIRRKRKMPPRILETPISRETIVGQVAAFLYAASIVNDNEEINNITFGDMNTDKVWIKIYINQPSKPHVINH